MGDRMRGLDRITIIGMGPIGASIGLALERGGFEATEIVGVDTDRKALARASGMDAVDRTSTDIAASVRGAGLVVLDAPLSAVEQVFESIGPSVEPGSVVTDTGSGKVHASELAATHLPQGASFVGGRPILTAPVTTMDDAAADLLEGADYCVVSGDATPRDAVTTVVGMVEALGSTPFFLDANEHDSFDAAVTQLPLVLSAALVGSTSGSPSWKEAFRLAGPEFGLLTQLAMSHPEESATASLVDPDALVLWLDRLIAELGLYRDGIEGDGEALERRFIEAWQQRMRWEVGATEEEGTRVDVPTSGQTMAGSVLSKRLVERYAQMTAADKRPKWKYPKSPKNSES